MEISIIIPTYNRADLVSQTLESVKQQTYRPIHLILVDNNSTDSTMSVLNSFKDSNQAADFRITILEEPKIGASSARNAGLKVADSEWVMFFDSDDIMDSNHVSSIVDTINDDDNRCDIVIVRVDFNFPDGKRITPPVRSGNLFRNHLFHSILATARYIVKRNFILQAGSWNENLTYWDDWELGVRLLLNKPRIQSIVDSVHVHVFVHDNSITGENYSSRADNLERAIDEVEQAITKSNKIDSDEKYAMCSLLEFKRITFAGVFTHEKSERGKKLYNEVFKRSKKRAHCSWAFPLIYHYASFGGRGSAILINLLV